MTSPQTRKLLTQVLFASSEDLLRYFLRRLGREDAADALAEVMATAWVRADSIPMEPEAARMWLFGIARNTLMHVHRGNLRRSRLADRLRSSLSSATAPPADSGLEVRHAVDQLDEDLAELVRLVHWDGFSLAEAAVLLAIPPSTARGRYQRAKEAIRVALDSEKLEAGALRPTS